MIVQNAGVAVASFVRGMKQERTGQCLLPLRGSAPSSAGGWRTATPGLLNSEHNTASPRLAWTAMATQRIGVSGQLVVVPLGVRGGNCLAQMLKNLLSFKELVSRLNVT